MSIRSPCEDSRYPHSSVRLSRYWSCARKLQFENSGGKSSSSPETASQDADLARISLENSRLITLVVRHRVSWPKLGAE